MRPNRYTDLGNGKIRFHYTFTELRKFLTHGFKEGNNGCILVGREGNFRIYRGFGTIENPWTYLATISVENHPVYDGDMISPEEVINPPKQKESFTSYRMVLWDARNNETIEL